MWIRIQEIPYLTTAELKLKIAASYKSEKKISSEIKMVKMNHPKS